MHEELLKDIKIVNPTGILQFDEENMDAKTLIKSFNQNMEKIKDTKLSSADDFTTLVSIKSMLHLKKNWMPC